MGKRLTYVLSGCMLLIMWAESGCTKQSLDHRKREGHVHIALQWDKGYTPAGSRFYFYPEDGSEAIVRDCPKEGFSGTLPEGSYRVIVLNSDARNIALRNEQQHQTAEIYVLPEEEGLSAVPCICQPGNLLLAGGINEADKLEVPYRDTVSVSASPHSRVKKIRFFFKLENFVPVVLCSGTLSGVSSSIFCATGACSDTSANVRFAASPAEGEYDFSADVSVLDLARPEEAGRTHLLDLTLQGEDGTLYPVILDLTDTIARLIGESGGTVPVEIPLDITLALIDNTLHASVRIWDMGGSGSGEL